MADLIPDINQELVFHEPTPLKLHLDIQQLRALVVLLTARVSDLETQQENNS